MRVLIAADYYPPFIGGGNQWGQLLARGLSSRGHDVAVATVWSGGMDRVEMDDGWPVYRLRQMRTWPTSRITDRSQRHSPPFLDPVSAADARRAIDEFKPDVCISYGWITLSVLGHLRRRRIPVLLSSHDYGNFCATRILMQKGRPCDGPAPTKCLDCAVDFYGAGIGVPAALGLLAARPRLIDGIAGLHSVSAFVDEVTWSNLFGPDGPVHHVRRYVIPPLVEPPRALSIEARSEYEPWLSQLPSEPYIFFAGALREIKGVHVLIAAYEGLTAPRPPMVLMGARYFDTPVELPEGVRIIESAPQPVVMAALENALLAAYPSVWPEPLGMVAIESCGSGVATIGAAPSGTVDVLRDGAGVLVTRGSVRELRAAMQRLIDDPAERASLGAAGRGRAVHFYSSAVTLRYEAALAELVTDRNQPAPRPVTT